MNDPTDHTSADAALMARAIDAARSARRRAHPNPWVGAVIATTSGRHVLGATHEPGGPHAEVDALRAAGADAAGGTVAVTLEPCSHHGRTPPCVDALIAAGIRRVVVGVVDPDPRVAGRGIAALRAAGIDVSVGVAEAEIRDQLAPYLWHRTTGRPWVVCKIAATIDGRTAAPDGTSQWITGAEARADGHRLRAESDAILVGANTVRTDNPALTVRHTEGRDPRRIVLGDVAPGAAVEPCTSMSGDLVEILDRLGAEDVGQLLIEGGATVVHAFHAAGLINRYAVYLAPALLGGDDGRAMFAGAGAPSIDARWLGRFVGIERLGADLRLDVEPEPPARAAPESGSSAVG